MATVEEQFELAAQNVKSLTERPDNDTMLRLYALYKQASEGDASGPTPGLFDLAASAKFHAWSKLEGTSRESAMKKYIDLVKSLTA